jgi:hypothetical protein
VLLVSITSIITPFLFDLLLGHPCQNAALVPIDSRQREPVRDIADERGSNEAEGYVERHVVAWGILGTVDLRSYDAGKVSEPIYAEDEGALARLCQRKWNVSICLYAAMVSVGLRLPGVLPLSQAIVRGAET